MSGFSWTRAAEGLGAGIVAAAIVAVPSQGLLWDIMGIVAVCTLIWFVVTAGE